MGQRTAIILQHVNKYAAKYYKTQETNTRVFYHGWGIGRVLPSQLISILNGTLSESTRNHDFADSIKPQGCQDVTASLDKFNLNALSFDTPKAIGEVLCECGNNNGGIFVRITNDENGQSKAIEFAYMLGYEEGGDYMSFCSSGEWMEKTGCGCIDDEFRKIYDSTIQYFKAVERS